MFLDGLRLCGVVLLLGLTVLPSAAGAATTARWSGLAETVFQNYGRDQGLPHPVPTALVQDHDGFIWVGTQGGLARWDGYRFKSYTASLEVPGSLPSDFIKSLFVDPQGRLWVGANSLALYDAAADRFETIPLGAINGRPDIGVITDDGTGGLWIGTDDSLRHLDIDSRAVTVLRAGTPEAGGLPGGRVQAVLRDGTGGLWVGTAQGLAYRKPGGAGFTAVPLGDAERTPAGDPARTNVSVLFQDGDGRIWIGTIRYGLFVIDRPGAAPRAMNPGATDLTGWISAICAAGPHEIWVGLRNRSIIAIDTRSGAMRAIRHDRTQPSSLAHDDIWALMRDSAGSLWVGGTGGLSYHPHDAGLIATVFGGSRAEGLSASDVFAVLSAHDGRVWMGFFDGGIDVVDPQGGRITALRPDPNRPEDALPPDIVFRMAQDEAGRVYIATRRGLYRADPAANAVHRVALPGGRDPAAPAMSVIIRDGLLWLGGEEDGLHSYTLDGPGGTPGRLMFGSAPADQDRLSDRTIRALLAGTGRDLWVGTRNGLNHIDIATGAVEQIPPAPGDPKGLPDPYVTSLLVDRQGRLWVGTFGGGLALMTGRGPDDKPRFRRFGLAQGMPHPNVCSLEMDGDGVIWAGTDDGLARIDPETLEVRAVRRADGSALVDYFVGASTATPAGEALFGSKGGMTVVRPGTLPPWRFPAPVVITDLRVGGHPMPVARAAAGPLVLTPETNSLAAEFAALDYTAPGRNRYAYRLEGYDTDWIQADVNRRLAVYSNLPPGDYTLRLRGSNRDGVWAERDLTLPLRVMPAWYQRLGVRLLAGALVVVAVTLLVRWRTAYLRRRQAELESQIADRTADLRAANDRLTHLATTDPLTGCANRHHFMERARDMIALASRHGTPLTLAILDLDEFKHVNDTHGHPGGDAVLALTGRIIAGHVRSTDLVGRIGGEEFALLMPHTAAHGARLLADRLRQAIGDECVAIEGGASIRVTASLGLAELNSGEDLDALYVRADAALYRAKQSGRNRVEMTRTVG
ncbi:two-component regulator propeller domain-containing protein [Nitrospirillum sp. BR 11163]|uniref:two-component regulator propeller domain-containing protein n=1 Tax=Nitrospirillum sp. BR 11163 TaxID=3104323 RepID=UPI002AFE9180|nr:two-component regulator propeller domain-containing protein [Nitrospirillum sp. BR 11163]MEA1676006.1 two-component regulator propeller domain-containing protein [Nitrospirillum sp. BR 11163]